MRSRRGWIPAFLLATSWVLGGGVDAGIAGERADSLFQAALAQVGRVSVKESIGAFEHVLKIDPKYAPAHHEMAKLYMLLNTPESRQHARYTLDEAIRLDPENVAYQMALGDLLGTQGFWFNAMEQYEKILKTHPQNARAAYQVGYYALKDFLKYQDMVGEGMTWKHWGEKDRGKAILYLKQSIELDPEFRDAYYQLGVVYLESKQPFALIHMAEQLLKQYPVDKDALLFCGLGYQVASDQERAYKFYTEALKRMDPEERTMMESVDLIATKEDQRQISPGTVQVQAGDSVRSWADRPERDRFWQRQDPLFLTTFNERRMEHYSRVAYANLCFSRPSKGIQGWQTDMGKAYIKFGQPVHKIARRPSVELPGSADQSMVVHPHLETWFYERFQISFRNWDGLDGWRFDTTYQPGSTQPSGQYVFKQTPPRYVDPYQGKKYSLPHQVVAFQEGDSVRVDLAYAIPKGRLKVSGPEGVVNLEDGIFLFDENWEEVYRKPDRTVKLRWPKSGRGGSAKADSLWGNHLISYSTVRVKPGMHRVMVEVRDQGTGSIGTFREMRAFSFPDTVLSMSDLLLARRIEARNPSPERREDLEMTPNPLRTFHRSGSVSVYFEVYNLRQDKSGLAEYEVSYRVGRPEKKEIDPALFAALDMPEARGRVEIETVTQEVGIAGLEDVTDYQVRYVLPERNRISDPIEKMAKAGGQMEISVTARYAGDRRDDFTYLQIDVGQMPAGVYKLAVKVRDVQTGQVAERETLFRVME